jgi:ATP-dependent Clp protease protease subunit
VMIHQPQGGMEGQASEIVLEKEEIVRLRKVLGRIYADITGQSLPTIARDLDRDKYLSASEAKEYGIVDLVASTEPTKTVTV